MRNLDRLAKVAFTDFNKRVHTEDELFAFCRSQRVAVFDFPTNALGEYTLEENQECIVLDPGLKGGQRLWVFGHEVGHLLFHHPISQQFCANEQQHNIFIHKLDTQANYFATLFFIPKFLILSKAVGEIVEEHGYPLEMVSLRQEFYGRFKK